MDSFGDSCPSGLEHHLVSHVGEDFCLGAIRACCFTHFVCGEAVVKFGTQNQHRRGHALGSGQVEEQCVGRDSSALVLDPSGAVRDR
jgi:hypothetical protein